MSNTTNFSSIYDSKNFNIDGEGTSKEFTIKFGDKP